MKAPKITVKNIIFITFGAILTALGLDLFLVPNKIAAGGVSGIATILHYIMHVPVGATMLVINILLFIVAFLLLGPGFGLKSIYGTVVVAVFVDLIAYLHPVAYTQDLVLSVIFGPLLTGIGMGIIFLQDASTGGTDIIAMIINKYTGLDIGEGLLLVDFSVTFFAGLAFGKLIGMYSLVAVIVNTQTIDYVVQGFALAFKVIVVTDRPKELIEYVTTNLGRGITLIDAEGGYTGQKRKMAWVILKRRRELVRFRNALRRIDKRAFIAVSTIKEAYGEGFNK